MSPKSDASTIRILAYLNQNPGPNSFRHLALRTGLTTPSVERAVNLAEDRGWLAVARGRPYYDEQDARPNEYTVAALGLAQVPSVLQQTPLKGVWGLDHGLWAERGGVGVRGLLVALSFPTMTPLKVKAVSSVVRTTPRSAANMLKRWAEKGNFVMHVSGTYYLFDGDANTWASEEMKQAADRRYTEDVVAREAAQRHRPRSHIRDMIAMEPHLIQWVDENC